MLSLGRELNPEAALLSPRGQVLENGKARFFRRFAEGVFDEEDVVRRAHELADFVVAAAERYGFDREQVTAVGYSNGANIAAALLMLRSELLAGAILLRAMRPLSQPPKFDLENRRILISAGKDDPIVPLEDAKALAELLRESGAEVVFEIQAASHGLVREDLKLAKQWLGSS
jgi:phospholipase/carboxylesterase